MGCPRCSGWLRPFGYGRTRTVRGRGADTLRVTPRRARCGDCGGTQILLPSTLTVRRADTPRSSVRRWPPRLAAPDVGPSPRPWPARCRPCGPGCGGYPTGMRGGCTKPAVDRAVQIDRELLVRPAEYPTVLGQALNLLAGAALRLICPVFFGPREFG